MALAKITSVAGRAVAVPGNDIDTDRIIPARFMKCVTYDGLGEYLFNDVRRNLDGTEKWLNRISNPEGALTTKQQGYYNYLLGIIYSQKNLTQAEKNFRKALKLGLNMDYDLAMAKLSLAGISMQKRRKREATTLLQEAKKLDKNNMLADQIKMMQQQLKKI